MYLNLLDEQERKDFLELAHHMMGLDNFHHEEEIQVFESYKHECHMLTYKISRQDNLEDIINHLKNSSSKIKKIILIELFGILLADGEVHENETTFISYLANSFGITSEELEKMNKWSLAMDHIVKLGYTIINRKDTHV